MLSYFLKLSCGWQRTCSIFLLDVALRIEPCLVCGRTPSSVTPMASNFQTGPLWCCSWSYSRTMKWIMVISTLQGDAGRLQASRQWYPSSWTSQNRQHGLASFLRLQFKNRQDSKKSVASSVQLITAATNTIVCLCIAHTKSQKTTFQKWFFPSTIGSGDLMVLSGLGGKCFTESQAAGPTLEIYRDFPFCFTQWKDIPAYYSGK